MKPELVEENDEYIVYDIGVELPPKDYKPHNYKPHKVYRSLVTRFVYDKQNNTASCVTSYEVEGEHTIVASSLLRNSLWKEITGHNL